jgi:hypothetical protein
MVLDRRMKEKVVEGGFSFYRTRRGLFGQLQSLATHVLSIRMAIAKP